MLLDALRKDAVDRVPELIDKIESGAGDEELERDVRDLCDDFIVMAVASLLIDGKADVFFLNLCRCGENWRRYLQYLTRVNSIEAPLESINPLTAAIVAGRWDLAKGIANLWRSAAKAEMDYEDEYVFKKLTLECVISDYEISPEISRLLDKLESLDQGEFAARIAVIRALIDGDELTFQDTFEEAVLDYDMKIGAQANMLTVDPRKLAPRRFVWLEGLSYLRVAEAKGLLNDNQYAFCPPLARTAMTDSYDGDWAVTF